MYFCKKYNITPS